MTETSRFVVEEDCWIRIRVPGQQCGVYACEGDQVTVEVETEGVEYE